MTFRPGSRVIPAPQAPEDVDKATDGMVIGEALGSFTAQLRRPKTSTAGITAQFFGEDGNDADVITALGLTRFKGVWVEGRVWGVKNHLGQLLSKNGEYPLLASFVGKILRPNLSDSGATAQIFCENGPNADAVLPLGKSDVVDALVYVELRAADPDAPLDNSVPADATGLAKASQKMTSAQKKDFVAQQRKSKEAWQLLEVNGFFLNTQVWRAAGTPEEYERWLLNRSCQHPGEAPCDGHPLLTFDTGRKNKPYERIVFCEHHHEAWSNGIAAQELKATRPEHFLATRQKVMVNQWVRECIKNQLDVPGDHLPTPARLYNWCMQNQLDGLLPPLFRNFVQ